MPHHFAHMQELQNLDHLPATRTTRPDVARQHLAAIFADHDLRLDCGRVDFSHQHAALCDVSLGLLRYGAPVEVVAPPLDVYVVQLTLQGEVAFLTDGFETVLEPGSLFVMNPDLRYRKRWSRDAQQLMIRIPRRRLQDQAAAMRNLSGSAIRFTPAPWPAQSAANIAGLVSFVCRDLAREGGLCTSPEMRRRFEDLLLSAILSQRPDHMPSVSAPDYLLRAEDYLRTHTCRAPGLDEMSRHAGVSERALQAAFRRHRGLSPMEASRNHRLELARNALMERDPVCVTDVALEFGFNHFGRFAQAYAARFGERPSDTLRASVRH